MDDNLSSRSLLVPGAPGAPSAGEEKPAKSDEYQASGGDHSVTLSVVQEDPAISSISRAAPPPAARAPPPADLLGHTEQTTNNGEAEQDVGAIPAEKTASAPPSSSGQKSTLAPPPRPGGLLTSVVHAGTSVVHAGAVAGNVGAHAVSGAVNMALSSAPVDVKLFKTTVTDKRLALGGKAFTDCVPPDTSKLREASLKDLV